MDTGSRLLLIGGGGHCRSILDCVLSMGVYGKIGIIDNDCSASALGIPVVGTDDDLPHLKKDGWTNAFISVGSIGSTALRRRLYKMVKELGFAVPNVVDPSAIMARDVEMAEGVFVGKYAVVNTGAQVGTCAILNTGSIVEHDCQIGAFAHISPGTTVCGHVVIGDDSHIGAASVVRQGLEIGHGSIIGAGSVVVKNVPDSVKAFGNPCKVVE